MKQSDYSEVSQFVAQINFVLFSLGRSLYAASASNEEKLAVCRAVSQTCVELSQKGGDAYYNDAQEWLSPTYVQYVVDNPVDARYLFFLKNTSDFLAEASRLFANAMGLRFVSDPDAMQVGPGDFVYQAIQWADVHGAGDLDRLLTHANAAGGVVVFQDIEAVPRHLVPAVSSILQHRLLPSGEGIGGRLALASTMDITLLAEPKFPERLYARLSFAYIQNP